MNEQENRERKYQTSMAESPAKSHLKGQLYG